MRFNGSPIFTFKIGFRGVSGENSERSVCVWNVASLDVSCSEADSFYLDVSGSHIPHIPYIAKSQYLSYGPNKNHIKHPQANSHHR